VRLRYALSFAKIVGAGVMAGTFFSRAHREKLKGQNEESS
jgi:hypothetical protein